jgi:hypothetical protein
MLQLFESEIGLEDRIFWSDESTFNLNGTVSKHNCYYWAEENPHILIEKKQKSIGLNVWAAICSDGIIGPYFFHHPPLSGLLPNFAPCNVNMGNYTKLLENYFWPQFTDLPNPEDYLFMQDGAPPHYSHLARNWLNNRLPNQWIGRGTSTDLQKIIWPPRSPDLTPCDFFLWGYVKHLTYKRKPNNLFELQDSIVEAFSQVTSEMCANACRSVPGRLKTCMELGGAQVVKNLY